MTTTTNPSAFDTAAKDNPGSYPGESFGSDTGADNPGVTATAKIASAAHSAVDIAAANIEHAEKALKEAGVAAGHKMHDGAKQAQSYSEDALESVKAYVNLYPLRSVGIALATGFLVSSLLKR